MKFFVLFSFLFLPFSLLSQSCHFEGFYKNMDDLQEHLSASEQTIQRYYSENNNSIEYLQQIVIPVVVHIVWRTPQQNISDLQIYSQIEALNRDFNGLNPELSHVPNEFQEHTAHIGIRFCLASTDPQGNPTTGIVRAKTPNEKIGTTNRIYFSDEGGSDAWDTEKYLNIWVGEMREGILGIGSLPNTVEPERDGVVISYKYFGTAGAATFETPYNLGRTLTHKVGHYLNLLHPWGLQKGDCEEDDLVEDTPVQSNTYKGCPAHPSTTCGQNEMTMNFMNEVDDGCMAFFTKGQKERMLASLHLFRNGLINEIGCSDRLPIMEGTLRLFPNPAKNLINIEVKSENYNNGKVEIYDALGKKWIGENVLFNTVYPIDISILPNGLYFLRIVSVQGDKLLVHKLNVSK